MSDHVEEDVKRRLVDEIISNNNFSFSSSYKNTEAIIRKFIEHTEEEEQ